MSTCPLWTTQNSNARAGDHGHPHVRVTRVTVGLLKEPQKFIIIAPRRSQTLPGVPRRSQAFPGAPRRSQAFPDAPRRSQALPGAPRRSQAFPSAPRRSQALPGAPRRSQALPRRSQARARAVSAEPCQPNRVSRADGVRHGFQWRFHGKSAPPLPKTWGRYNGFQTAVGSCQVRFADRC